ncbi:MAG: hypothetical protein PHW36_00690 [Bacilli bacterium]|nr:hypothetical protein [Bacilli bacterium]
MSLFRVPIKGEILVCAETESEAFTMVNQMMLDCIHTGRVYVGYPRSAHKRITTIMQITVLILSIIILFVGIWTFFPEIIENIITKIMWAFFPWCGWCV